MKNRIKNFFPSLTFSSPFSRLPLSYLLLTFLTLFAGSVASAQIPSSGLVGYWPFNGNANDESGNGNNGTVNGATLTTDRFGNANSAYSFDGVNDYIDLGSNTNFNINTPRTFSFWTKDLNHLDFQSAYLSKNSGSGAQNKYIIGRDANSGNFFLHTQTTLNNGNWYNSNLPSTNNWYHVVVIVDANMLSFYSNGLLVYSSNIINPIQPSNAPLLIGISEPTFTFHGLMDDLGIYNRALTPAEITQIYTSQTSTVATPPCPTLATNLQTGLVGYWPFCGNANDESGNGNNGTVNGATLTTDRFGNSNSAYIFDRGTTSEINYAPSSSLNSLSNITISMWVKLFSYGELNLSGYNHLINKSDQNNNHHFVFANNSSQLYFYFDDGSNAFVTNNLPPLNQWSNLTLVYNYDGSIQNSYCRFYIDGELIESFQTTQPLGANSENLKIGSFGPDYYNRTDGIIDDVSIYNRALTPTEITQLYTDPSVTPPVACTPFLGEDQTVCAGTSVTLSASGSSLACPTLPSTLQNGLVGYWPFCGNANDASGNGNNGTVNGATLTTDRFGNTNSAYSFDGVNDGIITPDYNFPYGNSNRTMSFWMKNENAGNSCSVPVRYGIHSNSSAMWILHNNACNPLYAYGSVVVDFYNNFLVSQTTVPNNEWHFISVTIQGQSCKLYIDGILQGETTTSFSTISSNGSFYIGADLVTPGGLFFNGLIDDVSIYNRALTAAEIQQLYTLGQSTYLWSTGATTASISVTPTQTTTYTCTVTDANGNVCTDSVTVFVPQIEATDLTICAGETTTLSVSGINSTATPACAALPTNLQTGLVGYWPFCGNANDESGNGNNGTVNGPNLSTDRFGNVSNAYSFDGVNDYVDFGNLNYISTGTPNECTVNIWVNPTSLGNYSLDNLGSLLFGDEISQNNGVIMSLHNSFGFNVFTVGSTNISICNCVPNLNEWINYTVVQNSNGISLFINGTYFGLLSSSLNSETSSPTRIGYFYQLQTRAFHGLLDDISVYNRALSAAEIQQLYTLGQTTYLWSNGATTPTINVTPTQTTTYTCTVTDANGNACTDSVTVFVPQIEATDLILCAGESTTLSVSGINSTATPTACAALPTNLQNGLVGYWPFCGNANDASGNGNNGTVNGATLTTDRFGNANSAYSFDGNDGIDCGNSSSLDLTSDYSVSYWYQKNGTDMGAIMSKNNGYGGQNKYVLGVNQYGTNGDFCHWHNGPTPQWRYTGIPINDQWNFVVWKFNDQIIELYKNGLFVQSFVLSPSFPQISANMIIGSTEGIIFWNGKIDEVMMYNRQLSNSEIQQLYTLGQTTYLWSNGATTPTINVSPTTTTTYTCTVTTNGVSCTDSVTVVVGNPVASITPNGMVEICEGESIALTGNGGVSYLWNTGSPTQSITVNTEAVYTVTVTDANGCTDTESQLVKVNFLPNIGVNNTSICAGQSATLTATGGLSYVWSPATGLSTTTGTTVTASPATSTVYSVTGTGANGCTNSATAAVIVNALPTATITPATSTTFCQGGSVVLNANTGTGLTYQWFNNASAISGATSASYTANASGSYTVTVTNASTCSSTSTGTVVTVNALPVATITPATATTFCQGGSVVLNANTGTGLSYQWRLNGTNITGATTSSYSANASGSYTVVVTNTSTCSSTSTATVVTVNALPTSTITPATATTFCQGGSVVLNANTGTGLTYLWRLNGNPISGATSSSYTANSSGSYTVVVTNASTCSSTSTATVVTVNALPIATITPAAATTFCQGGSVVLNANTGAGLSYQWFNNASAISGATSASYTANASGSYTVTVTNTSTCSSTSTAAVVTVNVLPTSAITASSATTFCQGGSVVLNANTGTGLSYQWRLNGNPISGATTSSYIANASGSYTVVVTNATTCSSTSPATVVTVNALPVASISPNGLVEICQGQSIALTANGGVSYLWSTGAPTQSISVSTEALYTVTVTDINGCTDTESQFVKVNLLPNIGVNNASICLGQSASLTATGGLSYVWSPATGLSATTGSTVTSSTTTNTVYTVTGTGANGCTNSATATVTVNALPVATIIPATATTFCQGGSVVLNANTGTGLTYQWRLNGNPISGATSSSYTANASGSYTVVVTNASTCSSTSTAIDVTAVPNADYFADTDGDGFGDITTLTSTCVQPQGYVTDNNDCKDNDASIYPGAQEICNDIDDDCNELIDDGLVFITYYADADGDTFGDANNPLDACVIPDGYVTNNTDCNDNNANQNAASAEICNGEDDDCDGAIDNGITFLDYYADADGDGFGTGDVISSCSDLGAGYVTNNTDCDDTNSNTNPSATETCNTIDDNCDGQIDEGVQTVYFIDNDGDTYGNPSVSILACTQPIGYTPDDNDCNDTDANINPGAEDIADNGIDENCDGQIDNSIFELNASINLYPNPTRSELNIQVNSSIIGNDLYIFDAVGKMVFKQKLLSTQTILPVSNFPDGNYIFRVGELVKRFVVQK